MNEPACPATGRRTGDSAEEELKRSTHDTTRGGDGGSEALKRKLEQGWGYPPPGGRRSHYFSEGATESLCRRHGFYRGPREDNNHDSPDNCAECKRRRAKLERAL